MFGRRQIWIKLGAKASARATTRSCRERTCVDLEQDVIYFHTFHWRRATAYTASLHTTLAIFFLPISSNIFWGRILHVGFLQVPKPSNLSRYLIKIFCFFQVYSFVSLLETASLVLTECTLSILKGWTYSTFIHLDPQSIADVHFTLPVVISPPNTLFNRTPFSILREIKRPSRNEILLLDT